MDRPSRPGAWPDSNAGAEPIPPARLHPVVRWTLVLFVVSIPFELPNRIAIEVPTLTGFVFLGATLLQPRLCYRAIPWSVLCFGLYLYTFLGSFVINGGQYPDQVANLFAAVVQLLLLAWALYNVLGLPGEALTILRAFVLACALRAAGQIWEAASLGGVSASGRAAFLGQNANNSAMILSAGVLALMGLAYGREKRGFPRPVSWALLPVMAIAVVQTGSRGGLAGLGLGLLAFALSRGGLRVKFRNTAAALIAMGLLSWYTMRSEVMESRLETTVEAHNLAGRERIYPELWRMFQERPLSGWGPIANKYELGGRLLEPGRERRDAHNVVLEGLTAAGLPGGIAVLLLLALFLRGAWRARRGDQGITPLAMTLTVLVSNMSGNWLAGKIFWLVLAYAEASAARVATAPAGAVPVVRRRPQDRRRLTTAALPAAPGPPPQRGTGPLSA